MRGERRNRGEWNNQGNRIEERKKKVGMETKKKGKWEEPGNGESEEGNSQGDEEGEGEGGERGGCEVIPRVRQ